MFEKICINCMKVYRTDRNERKFCCWDCSVEYRQKYNRMERLLNNK